MDNWTDYQGNSISDFIKTYRDSLKSQRDAVNKQLQQQRKNYFASVMGGANRRGMMYSNFPQRDKIRYDTETYMPSMVRVQNNYTSGLDALRNNAVNLWNRMQSYREQTEDLNNYGL